MSFFAERIKGSKAHFSNLVGDVPIPAMRWARQLFLADYLEDVGKSLEMELQNSAQLEKIQPGQRIAICVGSRGIANLVRLVEKIVEAVKDRDAIPFIVPTMGSHGGATAEGQEKMLASLGVTEASVGAAIHSSMATQVVGTVMDDIEVHVAQDALEADGIILVVRIKPHTAFRGLYESGFMKMCMIGLGKHQGSLESHKYGFGVFAKLVPLAGRMILEKAPVLFGVSVIENAFHKTSCVNVVAAKEIAEQEPLLLKKAFSYMGRLYFDDLDALIVCEIGKNFSGDGMDPNITGSFPTPFAGKGLQTESRVVLGLSEKTQGNSIGLGMADYSTLDTYYQVDPVATYTNSLTSRVSCVAKMPIFLPNDELAIKAAIYSSTSRTAARPRIVCIRNTGNIEYVEISKALWQEAMEDNRVELSAPSHQLKFTADGKLIPAQH